MEEQADLQWPLQLFEYFKQAPPNCTCAGILGRHSCSLQKHLTNVVCSGQPGWEGDGKKKATTNAGT